jgi:hypothetical protein
MRNGKIWVSRTTLDMLNTLVNVILWKIIHGNMFPFYKWENEGYRANGWEFKLISQTCF